MFFINVKKNTFFVEFKNLGGEFNLCGSGLLALAKHLFRQEKLNKDRITFRTRADRLIKAKN